MFLKNRITLVLKMILDDDDTHNLYNTCFNYMFRRPEHHSATNKTEHLLFNSNQKHGTPQHTHTHTTCIYSIQLYAAYIYYLQQHLLSEPSPLPR